MLVSQYKQEVKDYFEGGVSIDVEWFSNVKKAGRILRQNINPKNLKKTSALTLIPGETNKFLCPSDVGIPSTIYVDGERDKWEYIAPEIFHLKAIGAQFTIETVNGQRVIIINDVIPGASYVFEYYSKNMFIDKDTGDWKDTPEDDNDIINIEEEAEDALVLEGARLVGFGARKNKAQVKKDFNDELVRAYDLYYSRNPSTELPPSYDSSFIEDQPRHFNT